MAKITDLVSICRSKNAGPFMFTVDLFFDDFKVYEKVKGSNIFTKEFISMRYGLPIENVYGIFYLDDCMAIKISMYKEYIVGEADNRDVFTTQKHVILLDVEVDIA